MKKVVITDMSEILEYRDKYSEYYDFRSADNVIIECDFITTLRIFANDITFKGYVECDYIEADDIICKKGISCKNIECIKLDASLQTLVDCMIKAEKIISDGYIQCECIDCMHLDTYQASVLNDIDAHDIICRNLIDCSNIKCYTLELHNASIKAGYVKCDEIISKGMINYDN